MKIQINTDKTVNGDETHEARYLSIIQDGLNRYKSHITRVEMHLSDKNGKKNGINDIRCLLEARLEGMQPIAVTNDADSAEQALFGAIDKLNISIESIISRVQNH
jgi:hypothetical protein